MSGAASERAHSERADPDQSPIPRRSSSGVVRRRAWRVLRQMGAALLRSILDSENRNIAPLTHPGAKEHDLRTCENAMLMWPPYSVD